MPDEAADDRESRLLDDRLNGVRDVAEAVPGAAWSMPAASAAWQAASSCSASADISPTAKVYAESATKPSSVTPRSIERMSPSRAVGVGIPCTTMSFGEMQGAAGKPR